MRVPALTAALAAAAGLLFLAPSEVRAQKDTGVAQCGCDWSVHPAGFDCATYCCNGPWRGKPICSSGTSATDPNTQALGQALGQALAELMREKTPAEKAYAANDKGRKLYDKGRKAYDKGERDEARKHWLEARARFQDAAGLNPQEATYTQNVELVDKILAGLSAAAQQEVAEQRRRQAALQQALAQALEQQARQEEQQRQRALQEQARLEQARREQLQREQQEFERDKQQRLSQMQGVQPGALELQAGVPAGAPDPQDPKARPCDQDTCLAGCPTVAGAMGGREPDHACVARCLTTCGGSGPEGGVVLRGDGSLKESDYFRDLQAGATGPHPLPAEPSRPIAPPRAEGNRSAVPAGTSRPGAVAAPDGSPPLQPHRAASPRPDAPPSLPADVLVREQTALTPNARVHSDHSKFRWLIDQWQNSNFGDWYNFAQDGDPVRQRLQAIVGRLSRVSPFPDERISVVVMDPRDLRGAPAVVAQLQETAASAGNTIYVSRAFAQQFSDEALSFVLAHEMGHIYADHAVQRLTGLAADAAVKLVVAASEREMQDRIEALWKTGSVLFERSLELEADRYGAYLALRAGARPAGIREYLRWEAGKFDLLPAAERERRTREGEHPLARDRFDALEAIWGSLLGEWQPARSRAATKR